MKKSLYSAMILSVALSFSALIGLAPAQAAVSVTASPASLINGPMTLAPSSPQTALFAFSLNATSAETLYSVAVEVDPASSNVNVSGTDFSSLAIYKDDGSGVFSPTQANLVANQSGVNVGSRTTITLVNPTPAAGKFYVSLATSNAWSANFPADSITVTLPANGIITSAGTLTTSAVSTPVLTAGTVNSQLSGATAFNSGGTAQKETGDSVVLTFSVPTNRFAINSSNINSQFTLSNGHSFLDSNNNLGGAVWNSNGTSLTISLCGPTSSSPATLVPNVIPGDTITMSNNTGIADTNGNRVTGSTVLSGSFGGPTFGSAAISGQFSSNSVNVNSSVYALGTLSGLTGNAGGTVTYSIYSNSVCAGSPVFTSTQTVSNGSVPVSQNFVPTATGTYYLQLVYSGDAINPSLISLCGTQTLNVSAAGSVLNPGTGGVLPTTGLPPIYIVIMAVSVLGLAYVGSKFLIPAINR